MILLVRQLVLKLVLPSATNSTERSIFTRSRRCRSVPFTSFSKIMNATSTSAGTADIPKYNTLRMYNRARFGLPNIIIVRGSVLDFDTTEPTLLCSNNHDSNNNQSSKNSNSNTTQEAPETVGCIVNAANEGCLGGGGIDGAITDAGGINLANDRLGLPPFTTTSDGTIIRCPTGSAVITGPGQYGTLHVPYVIHAVGPNFWNYMNSNNGNEINNGYDLLRSAYRTSLDIASYSTNPITAIAFCLLSAGVFRGNQPLSRIIEHSITAIRDWRPKSNHSNVTNDKTDNDNNNSIDGMNDDISSTSALQVPNYDKKLSNIYIFAYTEKESDVLLRCSGELLKSTG